MKWKQEHYGTDANKRRKKTKITKTTRTIPILFGKPRLSLT